MRNRSPAKSAASSPPVPARTSRMALFSSASSFGRSRSRRSCAALSTRLAAPGRSSSASAAHLRIGARDRRAGLEPATGSRPPPGRRGSPRRPGRARQARATGTRRSPASGPAFSVAVMMSWRARMASRRSAEGAMDRSDRDTVALGEARRGPGAANRRRPAAPAPRARSVADACRRRAPAAWP